MKAHKLLISIGAIILACSTAHAKNDNEKNNKKSLPPGLKKNYLKGKSLPPGWQKKLSAGDILDEDIYSMGKILVPLAKDGTISIGVEDTIIRLHQKTREIISILDR